MHWHNNNSNGYYNKNDRNNNHIMNDNAHNDNSDNDDNNDYDSNIMITSFQYGDENNDDIAQYCDNNRE